MYQRWAVGDDVYVSPAAATRALRRLFLVALGDEAPHVIGELWALPSDDEIAAWAERHHVAAPWLLEAARAGRENWRTYRAGPGSDRPPTTWLQVLTDDHAGCWMGNVWLPDTTRARLPADDHRRNLNTDDALRQLDHLPPLPREHERPTTYAKRVRQHEAARRAAFRRGTLPGYRPRKRVEPKHLHWLVRHVVLKESYKTIARQQLGDDELRSNVSRAVRRLRPKLQL